MAKAYAEGQAQRACVRDKRPKEVVVRKRGNGHKVQRLKKTKKEQKRSAFGFYFFFEKSFTLRLEL